MDYFLHILILINIFIVISVSLNLVAGYAGLISLAHAAFFGIGAYTTAIMWMYLSTGFWINTFTGVFISAIFCLVFAYPTLRIYDDYFVIATFGFQMIVFSVLNNWVDFTKGPLGIAGIQTPYFFNFKISSQLSYFIFSGIFATAVYFITKRLIMSPFGRIIKGISLTS